MSFFFGERGIRSEGGERRPILTHLRIEIGEHRMVAGESVPLRLTNLAQAAGVVAERAPNGSELGIKAEDIQPWVLLRSQQGICLDVFPKALIHLEARPFLRKQRRQSALLRKKRLPKLDAGIVNNYGAGNQRNSLTDNAKVCRRWCPRKCWSTSAGVWD